MNLSNYVAKYIADLEEISTDSLIRYNYGNNNENFDISIINNDEIKHKIGDINLGSLEVDGQIARAILEVNDISTEENLQSIRNNIENGENPMKLFNNENDPLANIPEEKRINYNDNIFKYNALAIESIINSVAYSKNGNNYQNGYINHHYGDVEFNRKLNKTSSRHQDKFIDIMYNERRYNTRDRVNFVADTFLSIQNLGRGYEYVAEAMAGRISSFL